MMTTDWLWSIAFYTAVIFALVGAAGIIHPLRRVHRNNRRHAAVMMLIGLAAAYAIWRSMPPAQSSGARHAIDEFAPQFHFREQHETTIAATDAEALRRFTPYWRVIFPGSAILRVTWLRAIKSRAERAS